LTVLTVLIAIPTLASLIAPPPNLGSLARISRAVVFAEAGDTRTEVRGQTPFQITSFRVLENVSGEKLGASFEVQENGGVVGTVESTVIGVPRFEKGGRYLLFLDPAREGRWKTKMLAYGILREDERTSTLRPVPEAAQLSVLERPGVEPIGVYRKAELLEHLAAVAQGTFPWSAKSVQAEPDLSFLTENATSDSGTGIAGAALHTKPAACEFVKSMATTRPVRWFGFENNSATVSIWHTTPGQVGIADGGVSAVQQGAAVWADHLNSSINLQYAGSRGATVGCGDSSAFEGLNEVVFNDPCEQITDLTVSCDTTLPGHWSSPCCGEVAHFQINSNLAVTGQHDGEAWQPAQTFSVVVNDGAQCVGETDFREVIAHNIGHILGFGHHTDSNATMFGELGVHPSRGATLAQTDLSCAQYAYHTFVDVPLSHWSWANIEAIENAGITKGCGVGVYCPTNKIQRAEMAVFLVRGMHGESFVPPPATGVFADVPTDFWAAAYIEQLAADGITKGCATNPLRYCPLGEVTRAEMATFLVRVKHGANFVPPAATGVFADVPTNYWAAAHIEQVLDDGVTAGCATNPLRYCPETQVIREQMAAFLARIFGLTLPTP
ncbi:MAG TPA: S-layer homology domain-containing protein, partial [Thermoanaerobaculia bacterium]|nr:S-layer homology domain-containing protein [Thermoanaerobaculia bacterium]